MRSTTAYRLTLTALAFIASTLPGFAGVQQWSGEGPYGIDISRLAIDTAASALIAPSFRSSHIYRSIDNGSTWSRIEIGDTAGFVAAIVGVPGAFYISPPANATSTEVRIIRSLDGGASWATISSELPEDVEAFVVAAVDPNDPQTVFAKTDKQGIYRSKNGGETWSRLDNGLGDSLKFAFGWIRIAPSDSNRLYLKAVDKDQENHNISLVFRSTDGGDTWHQAITGLPLADLSGNETLTDLAIDPTSATTVYLSIFGAGLHHSTDGGETWRALANGPPASSPARLYVHPMATSTLYFLEPFQGLYQSTDGGRTWRLRNRLDGLQVNQLVFYPADPVELFIPAISRREGKILGGVYRSTDDGATFVSRPRGLGPFAVDEVAIDPKSPSRLYATSGTRLLSSADGGEQWSQSFMLYSGIDDLASDGRDGDLYLAIANRGEGGVFRSLDGGTSWTNVFSNPLSLAFSVAVDPVEPNNVYAGLVFNSIVYSRDRGETWTFPSQVFDGRPNVLLVDPGSQNIYAGTQAGTVFRSTDFGETWASISAGLPGTTIEEMAIYGRTRYVGGPAGLFRWSENSQSWAKTGLASHLAVQAVALAPTGLYVGTPVGVFYSSDEGESFHPFRRDSLNTSVHALTIDPTNPAVLYAGTDDGLHDIEIVPSLLLMKLQKERFEIEVTWQDFQGSSSSGLVAVVPSEDRRAQNVELRSRDSAIAHFFGNDNWELLIKVLDGTAINGHHWVFFAAATNVGYTVTVTDTRCGVAKNYVNLPGIAAPAITDEEAFMPCEDPAPPTCVANDETFCLGEDGRFRVEMEWTNFQGETGRGRQARIPKAGLATSDDAGLFYFFSENNWELLVKVLDGCAVNGHYWFFSAATTDVGYILKVRDTVSGQEQIYGNALGSPAAAINDTLAFATCQAGSGIF